MPSAFIPSRSFTSALLGAALALPSAAEPHWTRIPPNAASVQAVAVAPVSGIVYAGTPDAGVYRSLDRAGSWQRASAGLGAAWIYDLAVDPSADTTVYAATPQGVFASTDAGASWAATGLHLESRKIAAAPAHRIYAAVTLDEQGVQGVERSDDGGATWIDVTSGLPQDYDTNSLLVDPRDTDTAYVNLEVTGIFKTSDGGAHWTLVKDSLPGAFLIYQAAIDPLRPSTIYAVTFNTILKSTDGGASWSQLPTQLPNIFRLFPDPVREGTLFAVAVQFATGTGEDGGLIYRSTDGGATWVLRRRTGLVNALAIDPRRPLRIYAAAGSAGIDASRDGGTHWQRSISGFAAERITAVAADAHRPGTLYSSGLTMFDALGAFMSADGGRHWLPIDHGFADGGNRAYANKLVADPRADGVLYALGYVQLKTVDRGASWSAIGPPPKMTSFITDLAISPADSSLLYAAGYWQFACSLPFCPPPGPPMFRLARSRDGGVSWSDLTANVLAPATEGQWNAVKLHPRHPQTIYLAGDTTWKSVDAGATWARLPLSASISDLAIDPGSRRTLYALSATGGQLFRSADGGASWTAITTLPAGAEPRALVLTSAMDGSPLAALNVGTSQGVFVSTNGGATWQALNTGLTDLSVDHLVADPAIPGALYAITSGPGGLFALSP